MMNAEEDIDFSEEIAVMSLTSSDLAADLGLIANSSLSLSPHSSRHSSKVPSLSGDMFTKHENISGDVGSEKVNNISTTAGSLTPVELEVAPTTASYEKKQTASDLFGDDSKDLFSILSNAPSTIGSDVSQMSSFNIVNSASHSLDAFNSSTQEKNVNNYFPPTTIATTVRSPFNANMTPLNTNKTPPNVLKNSGVDDLTSTINNSFGIDPTKTPNISQTYHVAPPMINTYQQNASTSSAGNSNNLFTPNAVYNSPNVLLENNYNVGQVSSFAQPSHSPQIHNPPMYSQQHNSSQVHQPSNQSVSQPTSASTTQMNQTNAGLFIPSMYSGQNEAANSKPSFFTPAQPTEGTYTNLQPIYEPPQMLSSPYPTQQQITPSSYYNGQTDDNMYGNDSYQVQTGVDGQGKGIWQWIKSTVNRDWTEGAQNFKKQIRNATDSVLTTLDPGMEEYLKPVINIGVASQSLPVLFGVKEGFSNAHGVAIVKGQHLIRDNNPLLPVGFDAAIKSTTDMLEMLTSVNFEFPTEYLLLSTQVFITELTSNQWSAMICLGLKDPQRNFILHSFSQPIPVPSECVTIAYNRTLQNVAEQFIGYDITIDEAVKLHIPYTNEKDWCSALTGITLKDIISVASQCLASDYKRQVALIQPVTPPQQNYSNNYLYNNQQQSHSSQPTLATQNCPKMGVNGRRRLTRNQIKTG